MGTGTLVMSFRSNEHAAMLRAPEIEWRRAQVEPWSERESLSGCLTATALGLYPL